MNDITKLYNSGDVFEVRVLGATVPGWRTPHIESGYFAADNHAAIETAFKKIDQYVGVYATINPVNKDLLARANNRFISIRQRNMSTSDSDIVRRRWLFLDIDPERPSGISATDLEKSTAYEMVTQLKSILTDKGWSEPIVIDSGNGYYLLYRIDEPVEDDGLVKRCLQSCAQLISIDGVHVDTAVHNAARIARIPGTWNRKGENMEDRPHRLAKIVSIPDTIELVNTELLTILAGDIPKPAPKHVYIERPDEPIKPGDLYNQFADVRDILEKHGWEQIGSMNGNENWRRPNKTSQGHSATWNGEVFYVFSSAAEPFEANKGYSPFAVYSLLEHNGDFKEASRALRNDGYGAQYHIETYPDVDISEFLEEISRKNSRLEEFPEHLLNPPGFMGEVIKFNNETAHKKQPILALAGALALQAILCSRKVKTKYDMYPNIMICGIAPSGSGKDHARALNRQILIESNQFHLHAEGCKSGSALANALVVQPAILFQLDEYGRFLKASRNPERNPYAYEIVSKLLILYSSSGKVWETDRYASEEKGGKIVTNPHVVVYGTTVPKSLYEGLTEESVTDGFLARTLIFDVDEHNPLRRIVESKSIPESILARAKWWGEFNPGGGNLSPDEHIIPITSDALHYMRKFPEIEAERMADMEDNPLSTLWTRTAENANKLALLYSVSADAENPVIDMAAAKWGYDLAEFLTQRMIILIGENVATTRFHAEVLMVERAIRKAGGKIDRSTLMRRVRMRSRDLDTVIDYAIQAHIIDIEMIKTGGRERTYYVLI